MIAPLEMRRRIKNRKPEFRAQDSHKKKEIKANWRRPKGLHSKIRLGKKGYSKSLKIGYGSPKAVKGFLKSGLIPVIVHNPGMLDSIDKNAHGIIVASGTGNKKRMSILKKAIEKGLTIANIREPEKRLESIMTEFENRRKKKLAENAQKPKAFGAQEAQNASLRKTEEAQKEKVKTEKKAEGEGKEKEIVSEEEQKLLEKKEKDKLLTKRD